MEILPEVIPLIDADFKNKIGELRRLHPTEGPGGELKEANYDRLVVEHQDSIADALRGAGLLAHDSSLKFLGRQVHSIDVLFAEIDRKDGEFRQFVVFEDKLVRNPEARRDVLSQVLDYAVKLRNLGSEQIGEALPHGEVQEWFAANEDQVRRALRDGDFLLVVCGDRIHQKVVDYLDFLKDQLDPLTSLDVALLSLAIYGDGTQQVLIPYVVSALQVDERRTLRVVVEDAAGAAMPARVSLEVEPQDVKGYRREALDMEEILQAIGTKTGPAGVDLARKLFDRARSLGMRLEERGASVSARFRRPGSKRDCTIFAVTQVGTFYIGWLSGWAKAGAPASIAAEYEATLVQLFGPKILVHNCGTGGTSAPALASVANHLPEVEAAIDRAIAGLSA